MAVTPESYEKWKKEREIRKAKLILGSPTIDQNYIKQYGAEASKFLTDSANNTSNVKWGQSQAALNSFNEQANNLKYKQLLINDWLSKNAVSGSYDELLKGFDSFNTGVNDVRNVYTSINENMLKYDSEDAYNTELTKGKYADSSFDDIQRAITLLSGNQRRQDSEQSAKAQKEIDVLKDLLYTKSYKNEQDYDKAIADLDRQISAAQKEIDNTELFNDELTVRKKLAALQALKATIEESLVFKGRTQEVKNYDTNKSDPAFWSVSEKGKQDYNISLDGSLSDIEQSFIEEYNKPDFNEQNLIAFFFDVIEKHPELKEKNVADILGGNSEFNNFINLRIKENLQFMNEDEQQMYNYLFEAFGPEEADKYYDVLKITLDMRGTVDDQEKQKAEYNSANFFEKLLLNLESIPENIIGGASAGFSDLLDMAVGNEINPYSPVHDLQNKASNTRSNTAQEISEISGKYLGDWSKELAANTYMAIMSGVDSVAGSLTLGQFGKGVTIAGKSINLINGYGIAMGLGTVSTKARELYERGGTEAQIAAGSIASGIIEGLFETLSVELFMNNIKDITSFKTLVKNSLKQRFIEASEEFNTELANMIADSIIMGNSPQEATELFWAAYGGFISGGTSVDIAGGVGLLSSTIEKKRLKNEQYINAGSQLKKVGSAQDLIDFAADLNSESVNKVLGKTKSAENISNKRLGKIFEAVSNEVHDSVSKANNIDELSQIVENLSNKTTSDTVNQMITTAAIATVIQHEDWVPGTSSETATTTKQDGFVGDNGVNVDSAEQEGDVVGESVLPEVSAKGPEADWFADEAFKARGLERLTDDQKMLKEIGKAFGREVKFGDLDKWVTTKKGKRRKQRINGFYDRSTGTIYLNTKSSANALITVFKHELTHFAESDSTAYTDFANGLMDSKSFKDWVASKGFKTEGDVSATLAMNADYRDRYGNSGIKGTEVFNDPVKGEHAANLEMVADFVAENLFSGDMSRLQEALSNVEPEVVNKFKQFLLNILNKIKNLFKKKVGGFETIQGIEAEFVKVCNAAQKAWEQKQQTAEQQKTSTESGGQYSFAGQKARTADYSLLDQAIKLEEVGKATPEDIRQQTGWFRGYDGKWRYEISDRDIEVDTTGKFHTNPDIRRQTELFNKVYFDGTATEAEIEELQVLNKNLKGVNAKPQKLGQLIKHDKLFEAYPFLKGVDIRFEYISERGAYNPVFNEIVLSNNIKLNKEQLTKTLIHEIQHAIQYYEAFAGGSNTEYWREKGIDEAELFKYYKNTAGEVEARDAANRWWRSDEARKEIRPDIDRTDVVFADEGVSYSLNGGLDKYWYPAMSRKDIEYVKRRAKYELNTTENYIDNMNKWLYNEKNGKKYFALYSTEDSDNPTILYACKGTRADFEHEFLTQYFDEKEIDNESIHARTKIIDQILKNHGNINGDRATNRRNAVGRGSDGGNVTVHRKNSRNRPSEALLNCLRNIKEISDRNRADLNESAFSMPEDGQYSLPDSRSDLLQRFKDGEITEEEFAEAWDNKPSKENPVSIANLKPEDANTTPEKKRKKGENKGNKESNLYESIQTSDIFNDSFKKTAKDDSYIKTYQSITNKETLNKAFKELEEGGQQYVNKWFNKPVDEASLVDITVGLILMDRYQRIGDYESAMAATERVREMGTASGRQVQIFSIIGRFTPDMMVKYAQKELAKAFELMVDAKTKRWGETHQDIFKLTADEIETIRRKTLQAAIMPDGSRTKAILLAEICTMLQDKLPPDAGTSIRAWQRISMLLNFKTNIRNIVGNLGMVPIYIASDYWGSVGDWALSKLTGVRTTGVSGVVGNLLTSQGRQHLKKVVKAFGKGIYETYDDFKRGIHTKQEELNRYAIEDFGMVKSDGVFKKKAVIHQGITSGGKSFNEQTQYNLVNAIAKKLNALDNFTSFCLELGDRPFFEMWFMNSLNNQLRLNKTETPTPEMVDIATEEALQRTWQDNNTMTRAVSKIKQAANSLPLHIPLTNYGLGDMLIKFTKTPANIAKAIVDFSPIGLVTAGYKAAQLVKKYKGGSFTPQMQKDVVRTMSNAITGTMFYALVIMGASLGYITFTGDADDDKDVANFEKYIAGVPPYSIEIFGVNVTYDWFQPFGSTLAIAAEFMENQEDPTTGIGEDMWNAFLAAGEVFTQQSFLKSLYEFFSSADENILTGLADLALSDPSTNIPTFLSQVASFFDEDRRSTYDSNSFKNLWNQIRQKLPAIRNQLPEQVNTFGETVENNQYMNVWRAFFSPYNDYPESSGKVADKVYDLYKETGNKSVMPRVAPYKITVNGQDYNFTVEQRNDFQREMGSTSVDMLDKAFKSKEFKQLSDEEKVKVIGKIYDYATKQAKIDFLASNYDYELLASLSGENDDGDPILTKELYKKMNSKAKKHIIEDYFLSKNEMGFKTLDDAVDYYITKAKE